MTRAREGTWLTLLFTAWTLLVVAMSRDLSPVSRQAPLVVALCTLALLGVELAAGQPWRRARVARVRGLGADAVRADTGVRAADSAPGSADEVARRAQERALLAWGAALLTLCAALGMLAGLPVFLLLYLRCRSGEGWRLALAVAAGFWAVLHGVLVLLLRLQLYQGWLWSWLERL